MRKYPRWFEFDQQKITEQLVADEPEQKLPFARDRRKHPSYKGIFALLSAAFAFLSGWIASQPEGSMTLWFAGHLIAFKPLCFFMALLLLLGSGFMLCATSPERDAVDEIIGRARRRLERMHRARQFLLFFTQKPRRIAFTQRGGEWKQLTTASSRHYQDGCEVIDLYRIGAIAQIERYKHELFDEQQCTKAIEELLSQLEHSLNDVLQEYAATGNPSFQIEQKRSE